MRSFDSASSGNGRRRRNLVGAVLAAAVALTIVIGAQVTVPFPNFVTGTVAQPSEVNANFSALSNQALNRTGGTMTGTLTTQAVTPALDATYAIGDGSHRYTTGNLSGLLSIGSLTVGTTTALNGLTYTWPASQTAGYVLTTNGTSTLSWAVAGSVTVTGVKVGTYTAAFGEFVLTNGTFTVNLPAAAGNSGKIIDVKNIGTGTVTVDGNASETIDGALTFDLTAQYQTITLVCDGSNWNIR